MRFLGGIQEDRGSITETTATGLSIDEGDSQVEERLVFEGIKFVADFGFQFIVLNSEMIVKEFPELDNF